MISNFYPKQITITTSFSMLQHIPTMRSCDCLSLSMLLNTSSDASIVFIVTFENGN